MATKNKATTTDQPADNNDDVFNQTASADNGPLAPAANPFEGASDAARQHSGADHGRIDSDVDELAARAQAKRDRSEAEAQAGNNDDDPPVDPSGEGSFFMDLTKGDKFELVPLGTKAVASCTAAEAVLSGAGNPMINLRVKLERVLQAPGASNPDSYRNRSVRDRLMFIPPNEVLGKRGTIWRAKQAFDAFGVEWDAKAFRTQAEFMEWLIAKADLFVGSVAEVTIGVDDGTNGGTQAKQINPETGEPYNDKNTIASYRPYNASAVAASRAPASDEDLPF